MPRIYNAQNEKGIPFVAANESNKINNNLLNVASAIDATENKDKPVTAGLISSELSSIKTDLTHTLKSLKLKVVTELPTKIVEENETPSSAAEITLEEAQQTIYLKEVDNQDKDIYEEYIIVNPTANSSNIQWEKLGHRLSTATESTIGGVKITSDLTKTGNDIAITPSGVKSAIEAAKGELNAAIEAATGDDSDLANDINDIKSDIEDIQSDIEELQSDKLDSITINDITLDKDNSSLSISSGDDIIKVGKSGNEITISATLPEATKLYDSSEELTGDEDDGAITPKAVSDLITDITTDIVADFRKELLGNETEESDDGIIPGIKKDIKDLESKVNAISELAEGSFITKVAEGKTVNGQYTITDKPVSFIAAYMKFGSDTDYQLFMPQVKEGTDGTITLTFAEDTSLDSNSIKVHYSMQITSDSTVSAD